LGTGGLGTMHRLPSTSRRCTLEAHRLPSTPGQWTPEEGPPDAEPKTPKQRPAPLSAPPRRSYSSASLQQHARPPADPDRQLNSSPGLRGSTKTPGEALGGKSQPTVRSSAAAAHRMPPGRRRAGSPATTQPEGGAACLGRAAWARGEESAPHACGAWWWQRTRPVRPRRGA
jgi:hypothetical protein